MSCGLETPLMALLLFNLGVQTNKNPKSGACAWAIGLVPLGRLDLALLALPFAPTNLWGGKGNWLRMATPVALQSLLATWYFGSPLPNTFYAKLTAYIEPEKMMEAGLDYVSLSLKSDPILGIAPLLGIAALFLNKKRGEAWALALSTILYFVYSVKSSDYMLGRFLVPPVLLSMAMLTACQIPKHLAMAAIAITLPLAWINTKSTKAGLYVVDEKGTHFGALSRDLLSESFYNEHFLGVFGRRTHPNETAISGCVGIQGLASPLQTTIIDYHRITNPLLSRLPATFFKGYGPGHNHTDCYPYSEYFLTGDPDSIKSPEIRQLARLLKSAHNDPLWEPRRWQNIIELFRFRLSNKEKFRLRYLDHGTGEIGKEFRVGARGTEVPLNPNDRTLWVGTAAPVWGKFFDKGYNCIATKLLEHERAIEIPEGATMLLVTPTGNTPENTTTTIWAGESVRYESAMNFAGKSTTLNPAHINGKIEPFREIPPEGLSLPLKPGAYKIRVFPPEAATIPRAEPHRDWIELDHKGGTLTLLPGNNPRLNGILLLKTD